MSIVSKGRLRQRSQGCEAAQEVSHASPGQCWDNKELDRLSFGLSMFIRIKMSSNIG